MAMNGGASQFVVFGMTFLHAAMKVKSLLLLFFLSALLMLSASSADAE